MITIDNINEYYSAIHAVKDLPNELIFDFVDWETFIEFYHDDDDCKLCVDVYLSKLNEFLVKNGYTLNDGSLIKEQSRIREVIKANPNIHIVTIPKSETRKESLLKTEKWVVVSKMKWENEYYPFSIERATQVLMKFATQVSSKELKTVKKQLDVLAKDSDAVYRIIQPDTNVIVYETGNNKTSKSKTSSEYTKGQFLFWYGENGSVEYGKIDICSYDKDSQEYKYTLSNSKNILSENEITKRLKEKTMFSERPAYPVEKLPPDVYYIKRYITMHGKVKTADQVLNLLHSLQKAITERVINKKSEYGNEIQQIQEELIKCVETVNTSAVIEIDKARLTHYKSIVNRYHAMLSVTYLKKYISLNGKSGVKGKAQELARLIKKAVDTNRIPKTDRYANQLETAYNNLINFTDTTFTIKQTELNGLQGLGDADGLGFIDTLLTGIATNLISGKIDRMIQKEERDKSKTVISSVELAGMEFETLPLEGDYKKLIGTPSRNFSAMVHGMPGSGKTTWCILFAKYLAGSHNLKVLFATIEEGINHTAQEKLNRLRAAHPNLSIADHMPENLSAYDVVFIDSINSFRYSAGELKALRNQYPGMIFIYIFQSTKEGKFKGSQEYEHDVDTVIRAENGTVTTLGCKNRFGAGESLVLW